MRLTKSPEYIKHKNTSGVDTFSLKLTPNIFISAELGISIILPIDSNGRYLEKVSGILNAVDAIEFMTVINNYFDLGDFYIIRGYLKELYEHLSETNKFTKEELEKLVTGGALYLESVKQIKEKMYSEGLSIGLIR